MRVHSFLGGRQSRLFTFVLFSGCFALAAMWFIARDGHSIFANIEQSGESAVLAGGERGLPAASRAGQSPSNVRPPISSGQVPRAATQANTASATQARPAESYGKLPLSFEANQGQTDGQVQYLSRGAGYTLFLTGKEAVFAFQRTKAQYGDTEAGREALLGGRLALGPEVFAFPGLRTADPQSGSALEEVLSPLRLLAPGAESLVAGLLAKDDTRMLNSEDAESQAVLRMKLVGANPAAKASAVQELPGKSNYFIGSDPKKWRTNVPNYAKVKYEGVYPGVDLVYYGNQRQLEYDFVVAPGADPGRITLDVGAGLVPAQGHPQGVPLQLAENGDLVMETGDGEVRFHKPIVYQLASDTRAEAWGVGVLNPKSKIESPKSLDGKYVLKGNNEVGFEVASYDRNEPLVIDPVLTYSTYLGGSQFDVGLRIAVDSTGSAYVAGMTNSTDFPVAGSPFQPAPSNGSCESNYRYPYPVYACPDAFVAKLSPSGSSLVYSAYLGGSRGDGAIGIAVDSAGSAYVTGFTPSPDFPVTPGAIQTVKGGQGDAFVAKLGPTGSNLVYSTYLGGPSLTDVFSGYDDIGTGIAVDSAGNAYVVGATETTNFPTKNPIQASNGGGTACDSFGYYHKAVVCYDAFVAKINATGTGLIYSTYLGGSGDDVATGIALDSTGNVYVAGVTTSTDFPVVNAVQPKPGGGTCKVTVDLWEVACPDAFVAKVNSAGSALAYSTYLGGSEYDAAFGIAVDSSGSAYVTGATNSASFPTIPGAFQKSLGTGTCEPGGGAGPCPTAFVSKLSPTGSSLNYSTFLGGTNYESAFAVAVDSAGDAFVTGATGSLDFPTASPVQAYFNGGSCSFRRKGSTVNLACPNSFVSELNPAGSGLLFSTYHGGAGGDIGFGIALGGSGGVYVSGVTMSADFPTVGAFQPTQAGLTEAFVSKFSLAAWQQVPGLLTQIAVGSEGSIWGINSAGQIFSFNTGTQTWGQIPGQLAQIAVASDGAVWGINSAQEIYRFNSQTQNWDHIPGALTQIAVGSAGVVWGINAAQEIYRFNPGTGGWDHIPGALAQIAAGADGSVWGLNAQQQIHRFNPLTQSWDHIPGALARIAVGSGNAVWGLNAQEQIFHYNPQTQGWDKIPGALAQITVGANGAVWGINATQQIFTFNQQTQTWEQIPGALAQLAVGVDGAVWGINAQQQIYELNVQPSRTRTWEHIPGQLDPTQPGKIAVATDGAVWGINAAQQINTFNARTQSWNQVPGLLAQIAVGFGGAVWGINSAQQIFRFNVQTQSWDHIPGLLKQIAVGSANAVWGLNAQQQIFRYNPSTQGWQQIAGLLAQIAVGADGAVWGINSAGQTYRFNSQTKGWDAVPGVLKQIAVGSANQVWGINAQQQIFRYNPDNPPSQPWDWIPGALTQIAVAYDGVVWGLNSAQQVFTFDPRTQSWVQAEGFLTQVAVGSDGAVWGINSSQEIYRSSQEFYLLQ